MTDADGLLAVRFAATRDGEDDADWNDVLRRRQPGRDRHLRVLVAAAVVVAGLVAALLATPALGLVRDIIPFWGAAKAPQPVVIEFASMNTGAPAGMSPRAVAGETREIGQFTFAGRSHTLWIAPAKDGGFCFEWIGGWGGCDTERSSDLVWNGDLVLPEGVPQPSTTGRTVAQIAAEAAKLHRQAVPRWISGFVSSPRVHDVKITFTDGSTIQPSITWVSTPINAGFFAYEIPAQKQTKDDHLVTVQALDSNGHVVAEQPLNQG